MKIMAFLQNAWARNPQKMQEVMDRYKDNLDQRAALTKRFLAQSHSGRILRLDFGDLFDRIIWEECTTVIGGHSNSCPPPDHAHIFRVLDHHKPSVVLSFGRVAEKALDDKFNGWKFCLSHPAARGELVIEAYKSATTILKRMEDSYPDFLVALSDREFPLPPNEMIGVAVMMDKAAAIFKL